MKGGGGGVRLTPTFLVSLVKSRLRRYNATGGRWGGGVGNDRGDGWGGGGGGGRKEWREQHGCCQAKLSSFN